MTGEIFLKAKNKSQDLLKKQANRKHKDPNIWLYKELGLWCETKEDEEKSLLNLRKILESLGYKIPSIRKDKK